VAEAASATGRAEGPPNGAGVKDFAPLLRVILENQVELGLDDHQAASLSRSYFEHSPNSSLANTVAYVADILTPSQFQAAVAKLAERATADGYSSCLDGGFPFVGLAVSSHGDPPAQMLFGAITVTSAGKTIRITNSADFRGRVYIGSRPNGSIIAFDGPIGP
jgi:hypothetical protein